MTQDISHQARDHARNYLACWNETDCDRRRALIAQYWAEDASYVDPMGQGRGAEAIDALIAGIVARFPGHSFTLKDGAEIHNDRLRFSWSLGSNDRPGAAPVVEGTDFAMLDSAGRFQSVTGFLDRVNL